MWALQDPFSARSLRQCIIKYETRDFSELFQGFADVNSKLVGQVLEKEDKIAELKREKHELNGWYEEALKQRNYMLEMFRQQGTMVLYEGRRLDYMSESVALGFCILMETCYWVGFSFKADFMQYRNYFIWESQVHTRQHFRIPEGKWPYNYEEDNDTYWAEQLPRIAHWLEMPYDKSGKIGLLAFIESL